MNIKLIIILLVALLATIFFWQTTNRFLYPSKAAPVVTSMPQDIDSWKQSIYK